MSAIKELNGCAMNFENRKKKYLIPHKDNVEVFNFLHDKRKIFKDVERRGLNTTKYEYTGYHQQNTGRVVQVTGKPYLEAISKNHPKVRMDTSVLSGMPTIDGRRIPVSLVLSCLRDGMTIEEICEDYLLETKDVKASINYVIDVLNRPFHQE